VTFNLFEEHPSTDTRVQIVHWWDFASGKQLAAKFGDLTDLLAEIC
jgi:hypothetical protein